VKFLDVKLITDTVSGKITFTLHDKRKYLAANGKRFSDLRNFPHIDSNLADLCKYGMMTSQLHRYARRFSKALDFQKEVLNLASKMIQNGYIKINLVQKIVAWVENVAWKVACSIATDSYGFEEDLKNLRKVIGESSGMEQCQNQAFVGKIIVRRQEFIIALDEWRDTMLLGKVWCWRRAGLHVSSMECHMSPSACSYLRKNDGSAIPTYSLRVAFSTVVAAGVGEAARFCFFFAGGD